jgi:hypothetical protein
VWVPEDGDSCHKIGKIDRSLTESHFSASVCRETFTYPTLSIRLGSVRGREFILSPKAKRHVLANFALYDTFVRYCFCPTLKMFWRYLYSLYILHIFSIYFRKLLMTTPSAEMTMGYTRVERLLSFQVF